MMGCIFHNFNQANTLTLKNLAASVSFTFNSHSTFYKNNINTVQKKF